MPVVINGTTGITNVNGSAAAPAETGIDTDTGIYYGTNTVGLATNGTSALFIDASQNVMVGGASPYGKITFVGGTANASSLATSQSTSTLYIQPKSTSGYGLAFGSGPGDLPYIQQVTINGAASGDMLLQPYGGNVGIGTSSPAYKFDVQGGRSVLSANSEAFALGLRYNTSTNGVWLGSPSANAFQISSFGGGAYLNIDSSGNLLVGTTSRFSTEKFTVLGTNTTVAYFYQNTNTSGYNGIQMVLQPNGNNTSSYHFAGTTNSVNVWYLYGNGTTSYSSDARLKKNIETTRNGYLDDLMRLRVVKYNWHNDKDGTPRELGLIAQEVEEVFPNLVQEHEIPGVDGARKNIKHSVMEFILIKAIQELKTQNDELRARVAALEGAK